ncbi:DUF2524 family protein [Pontibacillus litoralis]|uniref:DUF2524 family protein n=1 Tax=Pontibacillus litoralis JSM 072002 TaxID=1385512 RepID=A0A0A5G6H9_9BACI|nr:DUF2524 family protein [Pontibacillus litoralis]KGX86778.1 hypothetical protein N784_04000 [Pontibacillus litoralis JSM 072002]
MATRASMDELMADATEKIEAAKTELDRTDRMGYDVDEQYTQAQMGLEKLEQRIDKLMDSANHQQKDQLHRLHLQVSQYLQDMILDHQKLH